MCFSSVLSSWSGMVDVIYVYQTYFCLFLVCLFFVEKIPFAMS